jgi:phosphate transport system substrate-binding protein
MFKCLLAAALVLAAAPAYASDQLINGAGSTFVYPIASKWFSDYNKLHPTLKFNYQSLGSGAGVKQITEKTVDFGASDAPMSDAELAKAGAPILQIPVTLGAVAVAYNVPGLNGLQLSPATLSGIFLGTIIKWNDPRIAAENPSAKLPELAISVSHRSDGSGTTAIFTDYLAKVSPEWKSKVGAGKSVKWPVGLGGKGNEGVTGLVKQMAGGIGYVELAYANQNALPMAALKNHDGVFVKPTIDAASAAAAGVEMPADFRVSITDPAGKTAYPISGFSWILVYKDQTDAAKGPEMIKFLWWAVHDGQKIGKALDYAPLPEPVVKKVEAALGGMTAQGKPVLGTH